jgi:hypothetical protein
MNGQREGHKQKGKPEMDLDLIEIRERMEQLALNMQQEEKVHWRYKWPLKRKVNWHVHKLLARMKQQAVRKWLRHAENLSDIEEKVIHICEPKIGRNLGDEEGMRSARDLMNCQEDSDGNLNCQVGNEMRSVDLIGNQEGRREIPYCQVGKGEEGRLSESLMNSTESSYKQGELMEEDQKCI